MSLKKYPKLVQCDSRGQIVIPKDMRQELGITEGDGFFIYSIGKEGLLLKKVKAEKLSENKEIVDAIASKSKKIGISKASLKKSVKAYSKKSSKLIEL